MPADGGAQGRAGSRTPTAPPGTDPARVMGNRFPYSKGIGTFFKRSLEFQRKRSETTTRGKGSPSILEPAVHSRAAAAVSQSVSICQDKPFPATPPAHTHRPFLAPCSILGAAGKPSALKMMPMKARMGLSTRSVWTTPHQRCQRDIRATGR